MVIFSEDFEGDLSAWSEGGTPALVNSPVHHGSQSVEFNAEGDIIEHQLYDFPDGISEGYYRLYFRVSALPANTGEYIRFIRVGRSYVGYFAAVRLANEVTEGGVRWALDAYDDSATLTTTWGTSSVSANTWYCIELWVKQATSGGQKLYVNGSLEATTSITTRNSIQDLFQVGQQSWAYYSATSEIDCVVVDSSYIGPESSATSARIASSRNLMGVGYALRTPKFKPRMLGGKFPYPKLL